MERRNDAGVKLNSPQTLEVENKLRTDLCVLRSMVGRDYSTLLLGGGNMHHFHHMANKQHTSSGERDTRLFELMYRMSVRVVWIALRRHYGNLIEEELNRLFRTNKFNLMSRARQRRHSVVATTSLENSILRGFVEDEAKLLCHSPAYLDLWTERDYRMSGIGYVNFETKDPRVTFLQTLFDCPEENLEENGMIIGILGLPRINFDAMLIENPKQESSAGIPTSSFNLTQMNLLVKPEVTELQLFDIPVLGKEEIIPVIFPRDNRQRPDIHFEQREDARKMWKLYCSHPIV